MKRNITLFYDEYMFVVENVYCGLCTLCLIPTGSVA